MRIAHKSLVLTAALFIWEVLTVNAWSQELLTTSSQLTVLPSKAGVAVGFVQSPDARQWIVVTPKLVALKPLSTASSYCVFEAPPGLYLVIAIGPDNILTCQVNLTTAEPDPDPDDPDDPDPDPDPDPPLPPDHWNNVGQRAHEAGITSPELIQAIKTAIDSLLMPDGTEDLDWAEVMAGVYGAPGGEWVRQDLLTFRDQLLNRTDVASYLVALAQGLEQ